MTFDHGDYAKIDAIQDKAKMARKLYRQALTYHPDARAYLGLGILDQKEGAYEDSMTILSEGVRYFPDHEHLNICLGISCIHTGYHQQALSHLLPFQHSSQALQLIVDCYRAQGNAEMARQYRKKIQTVI
jgi:tetratricopeptide (TPR) repeat protein